MSEYHVPVLLKESVDGLDIRQGGINLDLTFGVEDIPGEILRLIGCRGMFCWGFDQDEDALPMPEEVIVLFCES